jgi:hypothetical protein
MAGEFNFRPRLTHAWWQIFREVANLKCHFGTYSTCALFTQVEFLFDPDSTVIFAASGSYPEIPDNLIF